jgi:hypothetical protein
MRKLLHRLMHWAAVRSNRRCPTCHEPIRPGDVWGVWNTEVFHGDCLEEEATDAGVPVTYQP